MILEVSTNICVPDGGQAWHSLRSDDFSVVDLSPLSPALTDLITSCMAANPDCRPKVEHIVHHPVVIRTRSGREALAPESKDWIVHVLGGGFTVPVPQVASECAAVPNWAVVGEGDVEMLE